MFLPPNGKKRPGAEFSLLESDLFGNNNDIKPVAMRTGYTYFDIPTAHNDTHAVTGHSLPNGGLFPRLYTCIGVSGSGKTTTMIQLGAAIADNYWGGNLIVMDAEGNTPPERIMSLSGWSHEKFLQKCEYIPPYPKLTILDVLNKAREVAYAKKKAGNKIKIKVPYNNIVTKEFIEVFPPTVMIVDSVPALVTANSSVSSHIDTKKDYVALEKVGNNIDGMSTAKDNTAFLKEITAIIAEYNIVLLAINHITKEVPMGMFDKPVKRHPNLKAGEKLNGGGEWVFQTFGLPKFTPRQPINDRDPLYGDEIRGNIIAFELVKNKSQVSGIEYRLVFDKRTGFRPELSDFEYLFTAKFGFSGSPANMYLDILPEIKFTRKTLLKKCRENPILPRALAYTAQFHLSMTQLIPGQHPMIDFNRFLVMSSFERISIILGSTMNYPVYNTPAVEQQLNGFYQAAWLGAQFTGYKPTEYIHPVNVEIVRDSLQAAENGMCAFPDEVAFIVEDKDI